MNDSPDFSGLFAEPIMNVSDDQRLSAPSFQGNQRVMTGLLVRLLGDRNGDVLEVGSGTGQHIARFAETLPDLTWWPTDPSPTMRDSIAAWRSQLDAASLMVPTELDAAQADWSLGIDGRAPTGLTAIMCMNLLHIAPWPVTEGIVRGAANHLADDGYLIMYGAFHRNGQPTAPSNAAFDEMLRARNAEWGVRDMDEIIRLASGFGLRPVEICVMPANNHALVMQRAA